MYHSRQRWKLQPLHPIPIRRWACSRSCMPSGLRFFFSRASRSRDAKNFRRLERNKSGIHVTSGGKKMMSRQQFHQSSWSSRDQRRYNTTNRSVWSFRASITYVCRDILAFMKLGTPAWSLRFHLRHCQQCHQTGVRRFRGNSPH